MRIRTHPSLEGMDGILMLDHDPATQNRIGFIRSLLHICPFTNCPHRSCRLGEHGLQIEDIFPVEKGRIAKLDSRHTLINKTWSEPHEIPIRLERQTVATVAQFMKKKENTIERLDYHYRSVGPRESMYGTDVFHQSDP